MTVRHAFRRIAHATAAAIGSPYAFIAAVSAVVIWALCGPLFHYSDTWQLAINTSTTIVTFLVVFMIQNSQNRDSQAIHLKLDELICAVKSARNRLVDVEDLEDDEIARLAAEFRKRRDEPDAERDEDWQQGAVAAAIVDAAPAQRGPRDKRGAHDKAAHPAKAKRAARDEADADEADDDDAAPAAAVTKPSASAERSRAAGRA